MASFSSFGHISPEDVHVFINRQIVPSLESIQISFSAGQSNKKTIGSNVVSTRKSVRTGAKICQITMRIKGNISNYSSYRSLITSKTPCDISIGFGDYSDSDNWFVCLSSYGQAFSDIFSINNDREIEMSFLCYNKFGNFKNTTDPQILSEISSCISAGLTRSVTNIPYTEGSLAVSVSNNTTNTNILSTSRLLGLNLNLSKKIEPYYVIGQIYPVQVFSDDIKDLEISVNLENNLIDLLNIESMLSSELSNQITILDINGVSNNYTCYYDRVSIESQIEDSVRFSISFKGSII